MPTFVKVNPPEDDTVLEEELDDTTDVDADDDAAEEWQPESPGRRFQRSLYATVWRCRRPLLPHLLTGGVIASGFASEAITASGAVSPAGMSGILAGLAVPAAAVTVKAAKRHRRRLGRRVLFGAVFAAGWLTLAPFGIGAGDVAALGVVECAVAARWWQHTRLGYPADQQPEQPTEVEEKPINKATQIMDDWAEYVGSASGPLPGSVLTLPMPTEHGYAFTAQLARGKQTLQNVVAALPKISSGLEIPQKLLIAESAPPDPITGDEYPSRCRFQVITRSPITGDVNFTGPRRDGGLLALGPWADGSGEAQLRQYTEGSMWSTVVIGGTGIGKSRLVENAVISATSGGDTVYWYLDPQGGASSPALAEHADWFATMREAGDMLDAAIAILEARGEENAFERRTGFVPSRERPGLLLVVEECHGPFGVKDWTPGWKKIAREGRKVGVAIMCISQYPGLETFGNSEAMRLNIMAGNAVVLHTTSTSTHGLMAGISVDPNTLPDTPGYAYMQGSEHTGTRTAPFRNRNTAPGGDADIAARWLAAQPQPALDTLSQTATLAAGTAYRDRRTSTDTGRTASAARVEALRNGTLPADMRTEQPKPDTTSAGEMGEVIEFPRALNPADLTEQAETTVTSRTALPALTGSRLAIVNAVAAGATRPIEIQNSTGLKHRQVADLLKELVDAGYLTRPRTGQYRAA